MKKIQNPNFAHYDNPNGISPKSPTSSQKQNPEGIQPSSPGLRGTSYPGLQASECPSTLKGLRHFGRVASIALLTACAFTLFPHRATAASEEGFTSIFNGKDLSE